MGRALCSDLRACTGCLGGSWRSLPTHFLYVPHRPPDLQELLDYTAAAAAVGNDDCGSECSDASSSGSSGRQAAAAAADEGHLLSLPSPRGGGHTSVQAYSPAAAAAAGEESFPHYWLVTPAASGSEGQQQQEEGEGETQSTLAAAATAGTAAAMTVEARDAVINPVAAADGASAVSVDHWGSEWEQYPTSAALDSTLLIKSSSSSSHLDGSIKGAAAPTLEPCRHPSSAAPQAAAASAAAAAADLAAAAADLAAAAAAAATAAAMPALAPVYIEGCMSREVSDTAL